MNNVPGYGIIFFLMLLFYCFTCTYMISLWPSGLTYRLYHLRMEPDLSFRSTWFRCNNRNCLFSSSNRHPICSKLFGLIESDDIKVDITINTSSPHISLKALDIVQIISLPSDEHITFIAKIKRRWWGGELYKVTYWPIVNLIQVPTFLPRETLDNEF